jgi:intein-encoded DNA endonuclease-like protein
MPANYLHIDEVKILSLYKEGQSSYAIAKEFNCSSKKILSTLKKHNIERRASNTTTFSYDIDDTFFEVIDTEAKAYFLGFMFADGCNYEKNNCISISLHIQDLHIIQEFKKVLNFAGPIRERKKEGKVTACGIFFKSKKMSQDLAALGCIAKKSKLMKDLPKLPEDLMPHFIRGYFDGDGTVYKHYKWNTLYFSIIGLSPTINLIQDILIDKCNLKPTKLYTHRNKLNRFFTYGGSEQVYRIFKYLYPHETPYKLDRKYNKFTEIWQILNY